MSQPTSTPAPNQPLTPARFQQAVMLLTRKDADLAAIVTRHGLPPMWTREPGFASLVYIILEQQVSLASAKAAYQRLLETVGDLTPTAFLALDEGTLRSVGFSRQKAAYCCGLARIVADGELDLPGLADLTDLEASAQLMSIRGIGRWTADVYLLTALRRPDIWPAGDIALAAAAQHTKRLEARPAHDELEALSQPWRPWRAVAARLLWHHYLSGM
jgi:DNA-3-methyladenine glycosylase II